MSKREPCSTCTFSEPDSQGQLFCHANPPTGQVLLVPTPDGPRLTTLAVFPPIQPTQWCGFWKPAILIASRLS